MRLVIRFVYDSLTAGPDIEEDRAITFFPQLQDVIVIEEGLTNP